jgi:hypothetical protein
MADVSLMRKWLRQQSKDFYAAGFNALVKRWEKYIVACYATKDAVRIGNPFYYKILARNYNYSQLFLTPLHMYTAYNRLSFVTTGIP